MKDDGRRKMLEINRAYQGDCLDVLKEVSFCAIYPMVQPIASLMVY